MVVEYCKSLRDRNNFINFGDIQARKREHEAYISLFPFEENVRDYVELNGSIKGYKGKHYLPYICIDIDNEDLEQSKKSSIEVIKRLSNLGVNLKELRIYFSGGKGFHILITSKTYGNVDASMTITEVVKSWVGKTFGDIKDVDTIIYEPHRLIRLPNSKHKKTGLYKVEITYQELNLPIDEIKDLAKDARNIKRIKSSEISFNEKLRNDLLNSFEPQEVKQHKGSSDFFGTAEKGERNQSYFKQAVLFFKKGFDYNAVKSIIDSFNQASEKPVTSYELNNIIENASKYRADNDEVELKTFGELKEDWLAINREEESPLRFGLTLLDEEFNGKLRGKVGLIVGYGGSKKSMIAQHISYKNLEYQKRTLYSTMEMSETILIDRYINNISNPDAHEGRKGEDVLKENIKDEEFINNSWEMLSKEFGNKLLFCGKGSMTSKMYDKALNDCKAKGIPVDILIVDGLSMMGGEGKETIDYTNNSKELKELANKHSIFVVLIAHAAKGGDYTTRDLSRLIRGSEKIADNCDFLMTMSRIQEGEDYLNNYGVYRLWNKRGSGNIIQKVFTFDNKRLLFNEYQGDDNEILNTIEQVKY